jgi:class 3 adenylate cyclase
MDSVLQSLGLQFPDAAQERAFRDSFARASLPITRIALVAALALSLLFIIRDTQISPAAGNVALFFRVFVFLPGLAVALGLTYTDFAIRNHQLFMGGVAAFIVAGITVLASLNVMLDARDPLWAFSTMTKMVMILGVTALAGLRVPYAALAGVFAMATWWYVPGPSVPTFTSAAGSVMHMIAIYVLGLVVAYWIEKANRQNFAAKLALAAEKSQAVALLHQALPAHAADRMAAGERVVADSYVEAVILFADLAQFTVLSKRIGPKATVQVLDHMFTAFDDIAARHKLERVKTVGDGYILVGGTAGEARGTVDDAARAACLLLSATSDAAKKFNLDLTIRIGLHTGPVIGGVVGRQRPTYDYWGDTVNLASRLETSAEDGEIHCSEAVYWRLQRDWRFVCKGPVDLKGVGPTTIYRLLGPLAEPANDSMGTDAANTKGAGS